MELRDYIFKPSTLILIAIIVIFVIMAYTAIKAPNADKTFMSTGSDLLKILGGAVAGAYSGEKYTQYFSGKNGQKSTKR